MVCFQVMLQDKKLKHLTFIKTELTLYFSSFYDQIF